MGCYTALIPELRRQRPVYLYEFEASPVYRLSFRPAKATSETMSQRTKDRDTYIVLERWLSGLRALAALRKNLGLGPNTHMSVDNYITPVAAIQHPLLASVGIRHAYGTHTYTLAKHSYTQIK